MEESDPKGLDIPFRRNALELIMTKLNEYAKKSIGVANLGSLNDLAFKFEKKMYEKATCKQDYLYKIQKRLMDVVKLYLPATFPTENQPGNTIGSTPMAKSYPAQQNFEQKQETFSSQYQTFLWNMPETSSTMHPRNIHVQRDAQYISPQKNGVANIDQYNQSLDYLNQLGNQGSSLKQSRSLANLQGQINQYQDSRLNLSEMSNARLSSKTAGSAFPSFSEAETTNADHCQLLIVQFRRARSTYLPELHKWLKMFQGLLLQAQTINQFDGHKKHIILIQQTIQLLNLPENELILYGKEKLQEHLNGIIRYSNQMVKKLTSSAMNQSHQFNTNSPQNTLTWQTLINRPVVSSSTTSHSLFINNNSLLNTPRNPQINHSLPTTQSLELLQTRNQPLNSISVPVTSSTSKLVEKRKNLMDSTSPNPKTTQVSKKPCPESRGQSNSIPVTPTSVDKENVDQVKSIVLETSDINNDDGQASTEPSKSECRLEDLDILLGTPENLFSPIVSDYTDPVNTQPDSSNTLPDSFKRPIDRLMNVVMSISREALISGVDDMRSAITEMDKLPYVAYRDNFFLENRQYYCTDDEEVETLNMKIKREFESVSRDASILDNHDCARSRTSPMSKLEDNQKLVDEIKETNRIMFETSIAKVKTESNGTIIRCTYSPIAMTQEIKRMFASETIYLSVEFVVPFDYPISPPKILDCTPPGRLVGVTVEMTEKAKSLFDLQVQCVDPLTVKEIARVWDNCAQSVFLSYAKHLGASDLYSFSSKYGEWELVVK